MYLWFQGLGLLSSGVQWRARGGGGRGALVPMDEGGERCQKVLSALVGFLLEYLKPSTTSTVINFYLECPFLLRKLLAFSSCNVHVLLTILALLY